MTSSYIISQEIQDLQNTIFANNGGCQHIAGDDTNTGGYRIVVPDPTDCGETFRALVPGQNMRITVDGSGNLLTLTSIVPQLESLVNATMNGGGVLTVQAESGTFVSLSWTQPILVSVSNGTSFTIPAWTQQQIPVFQGSAGTYFTDNSPRLFVGQQSCVYVADPPFRLQGYTSSLGVVEFGTTNAWFDNPTNYTGNIFPLASQNLATTPRMGLYWAPGSTCIPTLSLPLTYMPYTLSYDSAAGGCSWLDHRYEQER